MPDGDFEGESLFISFSETISIDLHFSFEINLGFSFEKLFVYIINEKFAEVLLAKSIVLFPSRINLL